MTVSTGNSEGTKVCSRCKQEKPRSEFYVAHKATATRKAKLRNMCKDCDNSRQRHVKPTAAKVNRNRARHRAVADLIAKHQDEFEDLYAMYRVEAEEEAEALKSSDEAREHYKDEPVRLRSGARKSGQKAGDRIDVARCPHCVRHHDRGHVCTVCGAAPGQQSMQAPRRRPAVAAARGQTRVDSAALEEFNSGTQRAREAASRRRG